MSLSTKILIWFGGIFLIGALGFIIYKQIENSNRQLAIESSIVEQKQLIDGIVRSQAQWSTKADLEKFITDSGVNLKAIKEDLDKLHADVNAVNVIMTSSQGQHVTNISTIPGPVNPNPIDPKNPDPYNYIKNQQNLSLNEDFETLKVPFGSVGFSAWKEKPWNIDVKPREYQITNVVGIDENQRSYFYNKFTMKVDNKEYDVPIKTAITKQEYPRDKWSWWNPRLFLTVGGGINLTKAPLQGSANAGLAVGFMSYGRYKNAPTISLLQIGAAYQSGTQKISAIINPINFNIGGIFPKGLVDNTYIGPSIQIDTSANVLTGVNLSVGF